jgi:hypothetical protein
MEYQTETVKFDEVRWDDSPALLASLVCSDSAAHDRSCFLVLDTVRDSGRVPAIGYCVLLESPRGGESGILLFRAMQLASSVHTKLALSTSRPHPFDARAVTDFPLILHALSYRDDNSSTFMSGDPFGIWVHINSKSGPFIVDERFVTGTETCPGDCKNGPHDRPANHLPIDLDQDLSGTWHVYRNFLDWSLRIVTFAFSDGGSMHSGDVDGRHDGYWYGTGMYSE